MRTDMSTDRENGTELEKRRDRSDDKREDLSYRRKDVTDIIVTKVRQSTKTNSAKRTRITYRYNYEQ